MISTNIVLEGYNVTSIASNIFMEEYKVYPSIYHIHDNKKVEDVEKLLKKSDFVVETVIKRTDSSTKNGITEVSLFRIKAFNLDGIKNQNVEVYLSAVQNPNYPDGDKDVELIFYYPPTYSYEMDKLSKLFRKLPTPKNNRSKIWTLVSNFGSLDLVHSTIKSISLDIKENYNDDFEIIDNTIQEGIKSSDKGVVLLHGNPGTGKTFYLRHLIHTLDKKIIYVPASIASELSSPQFIPLLLENTGSVLVIEDAENIIRTRKSGGNATVSSLLNLSDGILSDILSTQLICTFNCDINDIDEALMRKGRIIARYEFGQLTAEKAPFSR